MLIPHTENLGQTDINTNEKCFYGYGIWVNSMNQRLPVPSDFYSINKFWNFVGYGRAGLVNCHA